MKRSKNIEWDPEDYDRWYEEEPGKTIDLIETECALSLLLPVNGKKILDVGCGTGNFTKKLKCLGYDVIGVEPDGRMRKRALEKGLNCVEGVAEELPFADESFDAVISVAAVEFFNDLGRSIKEMLRVSRKKVVVCFITGPWAGYYEKKGKEGHPIFSHAKFPKVEDFPFVNQVRFCLKTPPSEIIKFENEKSLKQPGFACVLIEKS
jgi:SAM-dependent methyltransferase